jgi:signal recognition particle subunit SRP54
MFESLSEKLTLTLRGLTGKARLTEENVAAALRDVRMALLEADVALPVVKEFVDQVKLRALGQVVDVALNPGEAFVKIVHEELVRVMGEANDGLNLHTQPPAIVLMAGLQGAGKTTTVAKLARFLKERHKKKVAVVSADVYRPAAIEQLATLGAEVGAYVIASSPDESPLDIVDRAVKEARTQFADVLLVDTAGRLAIDAEMMAEIKALQTRLQPIETLFVVDAMTGQDAANTAKAFNEAITLTGVVLAKADGDARGGAALSVRRITGVPIKFMGVGERSHALEPFHPERVASRILGMGDVLTLVEEATRQVDQDKAQKLARKLKKGRGFDFNDLRDQLDQMQKMGGIGSLLEKLPGAGKLSEAVKSQASDREIRRMMAVIGSMTEQERRSPELIKGSRKRRIAGGSGCEVQDVNRLLKQHAQMSKAMKKFSKGGAAKMMRALGGRMGGPGGLGGGGFPFR